MLNPNFVYLGILISLSGSISYIIDTLKGKTKPNKVTWFMWALAPLIAFSAQVHQGVGKEALLSFIVGFNPLLVFIASFVNKNAYWKITRLDLFYGGLSILGLILWYITKIGNIAILFAILSDGLAAVPTVIKAYHFPETENYKIFLAGAIAALITLLTIKVWNFENYAFSLYIFFICAILFILIKFKPGKKVTRG
ncbi:hypothetical protein HYT02_00410 [Candidatus Gottesmanbacteria bacterium]|nr:hypothetical protein [Candidatus Gottesmanbacteria bacterium]